MGKNYGKTRKFVFFEDDNAYYMLDSNGKKVDPNPAKNKDEVLVPDPAASCLAVFTAVPVDHAPIGVTAFHSSVDAVGDD